MSYPENSIDHDEHFIYIISVATLQMNEIENFLKYDDLRYINPDTLNLIKSNRFIFDTFSTNINSIILCIITATFMERVKDDKNRQKKYREHLKSALKYYTDNITKRRVTK